MKRRINDMVPIPLNLIGYQNRGPLRNLYFPSEKLKRDFVKKEDEKGLDKYMNNLRSAKLTERVMEEQKLQKFKPSELAKRDIVKFVIETKPSKKELVEILREIN